MGNSVGIIGYGRFGQLLKKLLDNDFDVKVYDPKLESSTLDDVLSLKTIFIAVPIRDFEKVICDIAERIPPDATVIDTCSVKIYPVEIMEKHLPKSVGIIATHPLFGPDSFKERRPLKMVMHKVRDTRSNFGQWKQYFSSGNIDVVEMTPEKHDQLAAQSQGVTHFIGRTLDLLGAKPTGIDTVGYQALLRVMEQTLHDSLELFEDLQKYNPYTKKKLDELEEAVSKLRAKL